MSVELQGEGEKGAHRMNQNVVQAKLGHQMKERAHENHTRRKHKARVSPQDVL